MTKSASIKLASPRTAEQHVKSAWFQTAKNFIGTGMKRSGIGRFFRGEQKLKTPIKRLGRESMYSRPDPLLAAQRKYKALLAGTGIGTYGIGNVIGNADGYNEGSEAGYKGGVTAGMNQGYNLAAAQAQNTPFLSRLMGRYQFDPGQLQPLQQGVIGQYDNYRDNNGEGTNWW